MEKFKVTDLNLYYGNFQALKSVNIGIDANSITRS